MVDGVSDAYVTTDGDVVIEKTDGVSRFLSDEELVALVKTLGKKSIGGLILVIGILVLFALAIAVTGYDAT